MKHKILVDLSVLRKRIQGQFVTKAIDFQWQEWNIPYFTTEYEKFRENEDPWIRDNVSALYPIADAARA